MRADHAGRRPFLKLGAALALVPGALASREASAQGLAADGRGLDRLADRLRRMDEDGLDPALYGTPSDAATLQRAAQAALTDLLHGRAKDLPGRVDLRRDTSRVPLGPWMAELASAADPAAVLDRAALLPPDAGPIKAALGKARAIAAQGGWERIPGGAANETIEPGVVDPLRVPLLRARLAGEDPRVAGSNPVYDAPLQAAVRRFQEASALEADGRIGRISLAALNRPPEAAVASLRANLDMRRAAAAPTAERRIEVNVPHQWLQVLDGDQVVLEMAVIVGKPARATPMLRVRMNSVQFNPTWGVPERNAREDLLPRFRRDPAGMQAKGFRLYGMVDGERVEIDPTTVDWSGVNPNRFPYFVRQDAGDRNALGRIKFIMPNSDDIYMHDTPDRHLFRRPDRAFSSGCIRLDKPMELLDIVMAGTPGWSRERVDRVLASRQTAGAALARTFPVRLHYTSVVVHGGEVRMRSDIYGLDEAYARALDHGVAAGRARVAANSVGGR